MWGSRPTLIRGWGGWESKERNGVQSRDEGEEEGRMWGPGRGTEGDGEERRGRKGPSDRGPGVGGIMVGAGGGKGG